MRTKRWMMAAVMVAAIFAVPMVWHAMPPTGGEARASIVCPLDLAATTGTINSIKVFGDDGRVARHHGVVINGTVNSSGSFECTIPYLNGQFRCFYVKEVAANPMGPATLNVDAVFDANASLPAGAQVTMASGAGIVSGGSSTIVPTVIVMNVFMGSVKIRIDSATAGGKFTAVLVTAVTS